MKEGQVYLFTTHGVQIGWGPPSLQSKRYRGTFLGGKAAEAWSRPLTSI